MLEKFKALTFDCYGTLIDWETGIWDALQPLFMANLKFRPDRSEAFAAFGRAELAEQQAHPGHRYPDILAAAHRRLAAELGLSGSDELARAFSESVPAWPAFADTADALRFLGARYKLVILSNVHRDGIAASLKKLGVAFDAVYTAEDIGSYKPADANFEYLLANLEQDFDLEPKDLLHTAQSLTHDHAPANRFGLANCWIDRQRLSETGNEGVIAMPEAMPSFDHKFFSLAELADAVRASETG